jgi:hypothetical protein
VVVHNKAWHVEEEMVNSKNAILEQITLGRIIHCLFSVMYMNYILAALKCCISSL